LKHSGKRSIASFNFNYLHHAIFMDVFHFD